MTNLIASYINAIKIRQSVGYAPESTSQTPTTLGDQSLDAGGMPTNTGTDDQIESYQVRTGSQTVSKSLSQRRWERKVEVNLLPTHANGQPKVVVSEQQRKTVEPNSA